MRSVMRAAALAVAVVSVGPAVSVMAQSKQTAPATWVTIPLQQLPAAVRAAQKKAFPTGKISKVERLGTGKTAQYHLTMTGAKKADVTYSAAGKAINK